MLLTEPNTIRPNCDITVKQVTTWKHEYGAEVFEKAEEPYKIGVAKSIKK